MSLSDAKVRTAKATERPQKLSDGGGLHLLVTPTGGRLWRLAYRFAGKQKTLAFGAFPAVSLADARAKRDAAKRALAEGVDPGAKLRLERVTRSIAAASTFDAVADEYLDKLRREHRAPATMTKVEWMLSFARPALGGRPIAEISAAEVLAALRKVEARGRLETARRLRSTIGSVFRYAVATARAENDPTLALRGALVAPSVRPRAAVTAPAAFGALLRAIESFEGQPATRAALRLMPLLYPRPGELRAAEWREFDLDRGVWKIPATRAKMRREHRKPLPRQAMAILQELRALTGDHPLVFPSVRTWQRPISENTLNAGLRRLGFTKDEVTAHGFRATASTLLNESGLWAVDAIERELGHVEADDVRRSYARGEHWDERVRMSQWWANQCDELRESGTVVELHRAAAGARPLA